MRKIRIVKYLFLSITILSIAFLASCEKEKPMLQGNVTVEFETQCYETVPPQIISAGSSVVEPTGIEKKGYVFDGWYLNNKRYSFSNIVTEDMTLVAKWEPIQYKITYIRGEGEVRSYTVEDEIYLPCVYDENYEFCGWSESYDGTAPFTKIKKGTMGNLTLYAVKKYQPYTYREKADGTYEITGIDITYSDDDSKKSIILPKTHNGNLITSIGERAFENCEFEIISIPGNIKEIGEYAFHKSAVKELRLDYGVVNIGKNAFSDCCNLENIYSLSSIENIDDYAFYNCSKLQKFSFKTPLKKIGERAFGNCTSLKYADIPFTVEIIEKEAFYNCKITIYAEAMEKPEKWEIEADKYGR